MKSTLLKSLLIILFCLLISTMAFYQEKIRAAFNLTEQYLHVEDKNSPLFALLLMPVDFPDEFGWYWQRVTQSGQGATSMLAGYYNHQKVDILQHVRKADKDPVWNKDIGTKFLGIPDALNDVHDLQDAGMVDLQNTECLFNLDDTIICRMKIRDLDISFELEINYDEPGNVDAMENILNSVIDALAKKLE